MNEFLIAIGLLTAIVILTFVVPASVLYFIRKNAIWTHEQIFNAVAKCACCGATFNRSDFEAISAYDTKLVCLACKAKGEHEK